MRPDHRRLEAIGRAAPAAQAAPTHQRAVALPHRLPPLPPLPFQIGPVEFAELGRLVAVRCPAGLAHIVQRAGAAWEPWHQVLAGEAPAHRSADPAFEAATDPLFRRVGVPPLD
jgi:hypothetical protein